MPFCSNCGNRINDNDSFCPSCGSRVGQRESSYSSSTGVIMFQRERSYSAKLVKTSVTVDNTNYGKLGEGESLSVHLPAGIHTVVLKCSGNPSASFQVTVDPNGRGVFFPFKIGAAGMARYCGSDVTNPPVKISKSKGRGCLASLVAIIAFLVVAIAILGITGSSEDTSKTSKSSEQTSAAESAQTEQVEIKEPVFQPVVGEVGDWKVTVNDFSYEQHVSVGLLSEYKAEDNSKYCIINITVKNCGKEADTFLPYFAYGTDTVAKITWNGYEYTRSELLWSEDNLSSETLNPLVATSGNIAFELPDELIESDIAPVLVLKSGDSVFECELKKE